MKENRIWVALVCKFMCHAAQWQYPGSSRDLSLLARSTGRIQMIFRFCLPAFLLLRLAGPGLAEDPDTSEPLLPAAAVPNGRQIIGLAPDRYWILSPDWRQGALWLK